MTREQFAKYQYRHSEIMVFHQQHPRIDVDMMLLAVDFDNGVFRLAPFDIERYEDEAIWVNYTLVDKKLRIFKKPYQPKRSGTT